MINSRIEECLLMLRSADQTTVIKWTQNSVSPGTITEGDSHGTVVWREGKNSLLFLCICFSLVSHLVLRIDHWDDLMEFQDKERDGIKTDCKLLCLDDFENSSAIYKSRKISRRESNAFKFRLQPEWCTGRMGAERAGGGQLVKTSGLELRREVRGQEVNTDNTELSSYLPLLQAP